MAKGFKTGGRQKGRLNEKTLDLLFERELLRKQILARRLPMTEAQMKHAEGVSYMRLRMPDGTFSNAKDEAQIDAAIACGAEWFQIFTQAPNPQAYSTLMAYAVDRPKEQPQELVHKGTVNIVDTLRSRFAKRKRGE